MRTANVEVRVALQARHTSTIAGLAKLADLVVSKGACANALNHIEAVGVAELDLRVPERTIYMYPVVVCGTLKWLARNEGAAFLLLSDAVIFFGNVNEFFLQTLLLSVSVALLLVCDFGLLIEVLFCDFVRTQDALVSLVIVSSSIDCPRRRLT